MVFKWCVLFAMVAYASANSAEHGVAPGSKGTSCKCGWANRNGKRIVGGTVYKENEYPFIAGIARVNPLGRGYAPFCGGSINTPIHIIIAAHCTDDIIKKRVATAALLGTHDRSRPSANAVIIPVSAINTITNQHSNI